MFGWVFVKERIYASPVDPVWGVLTMFGLCLTICKQQELVWIKYYIDSFQIFSVLENIKYARDKNNKDIYYSRRRFKKKWKILDYLQALAESLPNFDYI